MLLIRSSNFFPSISRFPFSGFLRSVICLIPDYRVRVLDLHVPRHQLQSGRNHARFPQISIPTAPPAWRCAIGSLSRGITIPHE